MQLVHKEASKSATYGSAFVVARTCDAQIIDLWLALRFLGVPTGSKSYMFGDNKSVVDSSMKIQSKLQQNHMALSWHKVNEAITSKVVGFFLINGDINPAGILCKKWSYLEIWVILQPYTIAFGQCEVVQDFRIIGPLPQYLEWQNLHRSCYGLHLEDIINRAKKRETKG